MRRPCSTSPNRVSSKVARAEVFRHRRRSGRGNRSTAVTPPARRSTNGSRRRSVGGARSRSVTEPRQRQPEAYRKLATERDARGRDQVKQNRSTLDRDNLRGQSRERKRGCQVSIRVICRNDRSAHSTPEWRNWQTRRTQNPLSFTGRVGSIPSSGTTDVEVVMAGTIGGAVSVVLVVGYVFWRVGFVRELMRRAGLRRDKHA